MSKMSSVERTRAYRERQKIKMAEDPEYAAEVKAKRATSDKKYRENRDQESYNKYMRDWYSRQIEKNPEYRERKNNTARKWYNNNREKASEHYRKWYLKNNRSEYNLAWSRANKDKRCDNTQKRRALLKGATIEIFSRTEIYDRDHGICYMCKKGVGLDSSKWHLEHIIPLSKGGQHTRSNVAVSCPPCNLSKTDKLLTGGESYRY